ncbi:MAG TPA: phage portal protein [Paludibacteraceae bacterium]|nr:phage portal protein [Paludibacteraceae bacterium]
MKIGKLHVGLVKKTSTPLVNNGLNDLMLKLPYYFPTDWISGINTGSKIGLDTTTIEGQRNAYVFCPAITAIINYKVSATCNGRFVFKNSEGKEIGSNFQKLTSRPNPDQNWIQFEQQFKTFQQIFGKAYIYVKNLPSIDIPKEMYVIPNWELQINKGVSDFFGNPIINYNWTKCSTGKTITIMPVDMMVINDTGTDIKNPYGNYSEGCSRLLSIGDAVRNIIASYEARNQFLTNGGPPYLIAPERDITGTALLLPKDKQEVEEKFLNRYGYIRGKKNIAIVTQPVKAIKIGTNPNDIGAFQEVKENWEECCRAYGAGLDYIFGLDRTTFNNLSEAKKTLYQDTIIPETASDLLQIGYYFGMKEIFSADFSHVECLQKSEKDKVDLFNSLIKPLSDAITAELLTIEEAKSILKGNANLLEL